MYQLSEIVSLQMCVENRKEKSNDLWRHVHGFCICFQQELLTYGQLMEKRTLCCDVSLSERYMLSLTAEELVKLLKQLTVNESGRARWLTAKALWEIYSCRGKPTGSLSIRVKSALLAAKEC